MVHLIIRRGNGKQGRKKVFKDPDRRGRHPFGIQIAADFSEKEQTQVV